MAYACCVDYHQYTIDCALQLCEQHIYCVHVFVTCNIVYFRYLTTGKWRLVRLLSEKEMGFVMLYKKHIILSSQGV